MIELFRPKNGRLDPKVEMMLGMIARLIPAEEYGKAIAGVNELVEAITELNDRFKRIEDAVTGTASHVAGLADRLAMLETIVRNNVDGAEATYAEQAMWFVPGSVEKALAPAVPGSLNDG